MASTPVAINVAVDDMSPTDLYEAFAGSPPAAQLVSLVLTNTTASPIDVDVWKRDAGDTTSWYIASQLTVPAHGNKAFKGGLVTFENSGEKLRAQASDAGVDAVGSVLEYGS